MTPIDLEALLTAQRRAYHRDPVPDEAQRRHALLTLRRFVLSHREALCEAISRDYGHRSTHETVLTEIMPVVQEIDHTLKHLRRWMRARPRAVDRLTFGWARNEVLPQPLGVVGVIVPWNFPLNLSLVPLVSILAAGNRALVKMSEHSQHLATYLIEHLVPLFGTERLCVIRETGEVGVAFSRLLLDHLLFTGSTETGRQVMRAAADNLCPVTLELGGRSPALIDRGFDVALAAERILYAKCLNAGQICTTVDHVHVPREHVAAFVAAARRIVAQRYPSLDSPDYTSLIHAQAHRRLLDALDDARARHAEVIALMDGAVSDASAHRLAPHLVIDPPADCVLMQREIFGPILPVVPYDDWHDVVAAIQRGPRPLAIYPFTHDAQRLQHLMTHTLSGGVSVNDALFHVAQTDLPFGGVGPSGMGHYHGREGFDNFSKLRPVFRQRRFSPTAWVRPPYGARMNALLRFLLR